jgi:hypothetical protein
MNLPTLDLSDSAGRSFAFRPLNRHCPAKPFLYRKGAKAQRKARKTWRPCALAVHSCYLTNALDRNGTCDDLVKRFQELPGIFIDGTAYF